MPQTYYLGRRSGFFTGLALGCLLAMLVATSWWLQQGPPLALWARATWAVAAGLIAVVAMGLWLRREWARRLAIGLLVLATVANLSGLWWQHQWMQSLISSALEAPQAVPPALLAALERLRLAAQSLGALLTLGLSLLLAWVVRGLCSGPVRQAFGAWASGKTASR